VVIRIRKSKDRQHNNQKKKDKRTNNDLQITTQKTGDRATLRSPEMVSISCSTIDIRRVVPVAISTIC